MTRVLQTMAGAAHGGAEAFFTRLVVACARAGLDQHAVIRRNRERSETLRQAGVPVSETRFGGPLDLLSGRLLGREITRFKPDVVLSWMNRATRACPAGDYIHCARLGGYYKLKNYRRCRHLIGNSRGIVEYIIAEGWPAERVHYLPNFVARETAPAVDRAALDTPAGAPLLLALGRLHENKAFDVLIEALAALPDTYLWLAGSGPLAGQLAAQAARLGVSDRVRMLGWRDDVAALYAAADLFICPSRHEPLGNVVIEAWAQGAPVIAAATGGPLELIENEVSGLLVPADDAAALADAIGRLIDDRALGGRLAAAGRAAYEADYTEDNVVWRYLEFFDKVAA
jgi:glycosyltransferase involved in cell wall biosynthesis